MGPGFAEQVIKVKGDSGGQKAQILQICEEREKK